MSSNDKGKKSSSKDVGGTSSSSSGGRKVGNSKVTGEKSSNKQVVGTSSSSSGGKKVGNSKVTGEKSSNIGVVEASSASSGGKKVGNSKVTGGKSSSKDAGGTLTSTSGGVKGKNSEKKVVDTKYLETVIGFDSDDAEEVFKQLENAKYTKIKLLKSSNYQSLKDSGVSPPYIGQILSWQKTSKEKPAARRTLGEYPNKLCLSGDLFASDWYFKFVETEEFKKVKDVISKTVYEYQQKPKQDTPFGFPVIDGASGGGKSRLGFEVGSWARKHLKACHIFVDCSTISYAYPSEYTPYAEHCLAQLIFDRLVPLSCRMGFEYTLDEVLERAKKDMGISMIVIQLDEYSSNQAVSRAVIRACRELFRKGEKNGFLVIPILTGIPYVNIRHDMVVVSSKAEPSFFSLAGVGKGNVYRLQETFCEEVGLHHGVESFSNLVIILSSFGGFPRLYALLLRYMKREYSEILKNMNSTKKLGKDNAKILYDAVMHAHRNMYGIEVWCRSFQITNTGKRISDGTLELAIEHLARIHTIAVSGGVVAPDQPVLHGSDRSKSYQELSAVGLFTLQVHASNLNEATIYIPLLTLDSYAPYSKVCGSYMMSPFSYSWEWMEFVALCTLRCHWNSILFTKGPCKVRVEELRPMAYRNRNHQLPKVHIKTKMQPIVHLASSLRGKSIGAKYRSEGDGKGSGVHLSTGSILLCKPNEPGIDGLALTDECVWLSQTKSNELCTEIGSPSKTVLAQSNVDSVVNQIKASEQTLGLDRQKFPNTVYDLFSSRIVGTQLKHELLPRNVLLTTINNFNQVAGPVFGQISSFFEPDS